MRRRSLHALLGLALALVTVLGIAAESLVTAGSAEASTYAAGHRAGPGAKAKAARTRAARAAARAQAAAAAAAWTPSDATYFNYPHAKRAADRFRIRDTILAAVRASPAGSEIRMSTFTFVDASIARALVAADRRGVSVQIVVNRATAQASGPFRTLARALNRRPAGTVVTPDTSFASTCRLSCRGVGGNQHTKLYLFSQVGGAGFVSMVGSANLTRFAAVGQWNHLDVVLGKATYTRLRGVFEQMTLDTPSDYVSFATKKVQAWVFPRAGTTPADDPVVQSLGGISCAGPTPTRVRISMYSWHDRRGVALARLVRQRADQGCDVRVIYSFASGPVLRILHATGHGHRRIPTRRSVTHHGTRVADYDHSKYVAVSGTWNGQPGQQTWTGSMNFTSLGYVSDDIVVRIPGSRTFAAYADNFRRVWRAPTSTRG